VTRNAYQPDHIRYIIAECYLGRLLVAATDRGIRAVNLADTDHEAIDFLRREFPTAVLERDDRGLARWVEEFTHYLAGAVRDLDLPLDLRGTPFQLRVWSATRKIPRGQSRSYREVARMIGKPLAARAVARACALNPVMLVIPCHRVVGADGSVRGRRECIERRRKLLEAERARD
jgi:AraC family transcriptional regulator, regulatory protein of adaptative response / methylated-DNA-[protein]-cysteine methyltransferase